MITERLKETIIVEKLTTEISYRALASKYNLNFRTIYDWVQHYQGKMRKPKSIRKKNLATVTVEDPLPTDVKKLQEELRKAKLMVELLNEVINVAEEELKIPIRKKSGTK
jgi:transposase-like protein